MRARELNPVDKVVIGVGAIHGGTVNNVICDHVEMNVSIRTQKTELDQHIYKRITQIAESVANDMGGRAELETYKYVPALVNDLTIVDALESAAIKIVGKDNIFPRREALGGEDFAYYIQHKPGAMFNVGIRDEGMPHIPGHNGKLVVSENALECAPKIFVQYVLDRMEK
jgi:metal-dependent amidase/aminoacylase/carboxypeptidase family protein